MVQAAQTAAMLVFRKQVNSAHALITLASAEDATAGSAGSLTTTEKLKQGDKYAEKNIKQKTIHCV